MDRSKCIVRTALAVVSKSLLAALVLFVVHSIYTGQLGQA